MPPYSPNFMPLEEVFAEAKGFLRANCYYSHAVTTVTSESCAAYVHHAGYHIASNPGFPYRILSRSFTSDFSPKLRDRIRNGKPGFEASYHMYDYVNT